MHCLTLIILIQTKICSPTELDCVKSLKVKVSKDECYEHCEGSILNVEKLSGVKNLGDLALLIYRYENYKNPESSNITFPYGMKG